MTVEELIDLLKQYPANLEVSVFVQDLRTTKSRKSRDQYVATSILSGTYASRLYPLKSETPSDADHQMVLLETDDLI